MRQKKQHGRRDLRWDRIALVAAGMLLLLALIIWGLVALFSGGKAPADSSSLAASSSEELPPVQPAVDLSQWNLVLVNAASPLPADFTVTTGMLTNSLTVDERILADLNTMMEDARAQGVELIVCSAYRSVDYQTTLYQNKVAELVAEGYAQEAAEQEAASIVAYPGTSEHNSGLAVDLVTPAYQVLDEGYAETDAAGWLAANAPEYGFILRYPKGMEAVTGIIYEPWHYRYVGRKYAREITDSGLCFEQWIEQQKALNGLSAAATAAVAESGASDAE